MTDEEINNKVMGFQQIIIDSQSKDIQEISRDYVKLQEKYTKLKEAVEKIKADIDVLNSRKCYETYAVERPWDEMKNKVFEIFDKYMEGLT